MKLNEIGNPSVASPHRKWTNELAADFAKIAKDCGWRLYGKSEYTVEGAVLGGTFRADQEARDTNDSDVMPFYDQRRLLLKMLAVKLKALMDSGLTVHAGGYRVGPRMNPALTVNQLSGVLSTEIPSTQFDGSAFELYFVVSVPKSIKDIPHTKWLPKHED